MRSRQSAPAGRVRGPCTGWRITVRLPEAQCPADRPRFLSREHRSTAATALVRPPGSAQLEDSSSSQVLGNHLGTPEWRAVAADNRVRRANCHKRRSETAKPTGPGKRGQHPRGAQMTVWLLVLGCVRGKSSSRTGKGYGMALWVSAKPSSVDAEELMRETKAPQRVGAGSS